MSKNHNTITDSSTYNIQPQNNLAGNVIFLTHAIMLQNCLLLFHMISNQNNRADRKLFTLADSSGVERLMDMVKDLLYLTSERIITNIRT